jgi:hypothetical protein
VGDVEVALLEQRHVVRPRRAVVALPVPLLRHELVDVVEALVVPGVGDDPAVLGDADVGGLVLEAPQ